MTRDAQLILIAGALLAVGVEASLAAARVRLPALVLLVGIGPAGAPSGGVLVAVRLHLRHR
jgi:hypothetical protein